MAAIFIFVFKCGDFLHLRFVIIFDSLQTGELLKLKSQVELSDESSPVNSSMRNTDGAVSGPKQSESLKPPRFTWMDEHFPATKICRLISIKETPKDTVPSNLGDNDSEGGIDSSNQSNNSTEKIIFNTFKSVKELSLGGEKSNGVSSVDMKKKTPDEFEPCFAEVFVETRERKKINEKPNTYVKEKELATKIRQGLAADVQEKVKQIQAEGDEQVNRKVQQNLALVLKKLGEANPNITIDIEELCDSYE
ncbi:hypothetical protein OROMI_024223 [Orobanche minor]